MALGWALSLLLFMCFDIWYFIRGIISAVVCSYRKLLKRKKSLLDEVSTFGICLSNDLDFFGHMNNGRYMRECDFGRYELWIMTGVFDAIKSLGGSIILGASTIRYRKSLQLFDTFQLKTKVLCWDEKSFYLEQRFERSKDKFVMAIVLLRQTLQGVMPSEVIAKVEGKDRQSPEFPDFVKTWISYNDQSSAILRLNKDKNR